MRHSRVKTACQAIGDDRRSQRFIRTARGRGYRFVAPWTKRPSPIRSREHPVRSIQNESWRLPVRNNGRDGDACPGNAIPGSRPRPRAPEDLISRSAWQQVRSGSRCGTRLSPDRSPRLPTPSERLCTITRCECSPRPCLGRGVRIRRESQGRPFGIKSSEVVADGRRGGWLVPGHGVPFPLTCPSRVPARIGRPVAAGPRR